LARYDPLPHREDIRGDAAQCAPAAVVQPHDKFWAVERTFTKPALAEPETARRCLVVAAYLTAGAMKLDVLVCVRNVPHELKVRGCVFNQFATILADCHGTVDIWRACGPVTEHALCQIV